MLSATSLLAQATDSAEIVPSSHAVTAHPFSAIKFTRTIHIGSDGTSVTTAEQRHRMIARAEDGRVFMTESRSPTERSCDLPNIGKLPVCDEWFIIIFDPNAGRIWHWGTGARDDPTQYVEIALASDQTAEAKQLTSAPPIQTIDNSAKDVHMQDLGEKSIEGLSARGIRTVTLHNDAAQGTPKLTIHEVWTSTDMGLVLKMIDGDPTGDETISGLEHISLASIPAFFQLPTERILRHGKGSSLGFDKDSLENWLVH